MGSRPQTWIPAGSISPELDNGIQQQHQHREEVQGQGCPTKAAVRLLRGASRTCPKQFQLWCWWQWFLHTFAHPPAEEHRCTPGGPAPTPAPRTQLHAHTGAHSQGRIFAKQSVPSSFSHHCLFACASPMTNTLGNPAPRTAALCEPQSM